MDEALVVALVRALAAAGEAAASLPPEDGLREVARVARTVGLPPDEVAIVDHAARATLAPRSLTRAHLQPMWNAGLDDTAVHDVVHVEACFAYMNRLADALGVAVKGDERRAWAARLLGAGALAAHDAWAAGRDREALSSE